MSGPCRARGVTKGDVHARLFGVDLLLALTLRDGR